MAVNFHSPEGLFDTFHNLFRLYNVYSIPNGYIRSVSPVDLFPQHDFPTLVLGDFNIHHSASDPTRLLSDQDQFISSPYFDRASAYLFSLLNTPGIYTRFPFTTNHRPAVLDLSFANSALLPYFSAWNPSLPLTGSDHTPLTIMLSTPLLKPPPRGLTGSTQNGTTSHLCSPICHSWPPLLSSHHTHLTAGSTTALPRSRTSSPSTPQPTAHPALLNRGGLENLHSYAAYIIIPPAS